jgi:S1-C subfamily serine protease
VGLPERDGLLVRGVEDDSPAAHAGLLVGDLLVETGGRPLHSIDDLFDALDDAVAAGALPLRVVRGSDEVDVRVDLSPNADSGAEHGRV